MSTSCALRMRNATPAGRVALNSQARRIASVSRAPRKSPQCHWPVIRVRHPAMAVAVALTFACTQREKAGKPDTAEISTLDTAPPLPYAMARDPSKRAAKAPTNSPLSPLADSISAYLVFAPVGEGWFLASVRNRRIYVDIGRVDAEVRRDSSRAAAYRQGVERRSTVPLGTVFRLRGPWGAEDVKATAADTWNGRIVLRVTGSAALDSLARGKAAFVATAFRTDSAAPPVADSCIRSTPLSAELAERLASLRDSLMQELRTGPQPPYERLQRKLSFASSQVVGCFGAARVALAVSVKAGNTEWVRERIILVDTVGKATPLRVSDYRFRAHELLLAFDADGDGVDDIATRATTERAGATTVLLLDLKAKRLTRLVAGFAWEDQ
jgi:hypothetical protein